MRKIDKCLNQINKLPFLLYTEIYMSLVLNAGKIYSKLYKVLNAIKNEITLNK